MGSMEKLCKHMQTFWQQTIANPASAMPKGLHITFIKIWGLKSQKAVLKESPRVQDSRTCWKKSGEEKPTTLEGPNCSAQLIADQQMILPGVALEDQDLCSQPHKFGSGAVSPWFLDMSKPSKTCDASTQANSTPYRFPPSNDPELLQRQRSSSQNSHGSTQAQEPQSSHLGSGA